jgi:phytanoyl-CoA hydroxylase
MSESDYVRSFNENGYVIMPELLSEQEIGPISDEIDRIITGKSDYIPAESILYEADLSIRRVRNVFGLHRFHPVFMDLARHPKIVATVGQALGNPLRLYSSQLFAKPGSGGSAVPLHQDMPYWPFEPSEMVSAWIALDDSTLENGCVLFLPGSHKLGMLRHVKSGVLGNSLKLEDERVVGIKEHPVEVRRGSCVLHHCLTAHRSEQNLSAHPRRGLIYIYMSPQVRVTDPTKLGCPVDFPVVSTLESREI